LKLILIEGCQSKRKPSIGFHQDQKQEQFKFKSKIKIKGGGQECPPYTHQCGDDHWLLPRVFFYANFADQLSR